MGSFSIRKYRKKDYAAVCHLFAEGTMEHFPAACLYVLKAPRVYVTLLLLFASMLLGTKSYILSFTCLAAILAGGWWVINSKYHNYVIEIQREDLQDIETTYMVRSNSCFWVAESDGKVVGMVAAQPSEESEDEMVLKRLCVGRDHRRKGIAKALCLKVIGFAKECGYKAVCLETDIIQYSAQKLYQRIGFQKYRLKVHQGLFGKCTTFSSLYYKYTVTNS
eukprot:XP_002936328.2 PREDICTED: probable N-acetyltransferase camello [Xenopus tropicalis]